MKRIITVVLIIFCFLGIAFGKIGIHLINTKMENEGAILSKLTPTAKRVLEKTFSAEPQKYNLRLELTEALRELQMQKVGLSESGGFKYLEAVDYFIISSLWVDSGLVIFELRAMEAETTRIIFSKGITTTEGSFEKELEKLCLELKSAIDSIKEEEKLQKDTITVYKIEEDGNKFLDGSCTSMLLSGLFNTGEFEVIEREQAGFAVQEKEAQAIGIVNRDPMKKFKSFYNLKLSIEGFVVSKNEGIISFEIKVVDLERATLLFSIYRECYSILEMREVIFDIAKTIAEKYYRKTGKVEVTSIPSDASIYINGSYWAKTPIIITEIDKGTYNFLFQKEGYENCEKQVNVIAGKTIKLNVNLIKQDIKYFKLGLEAEKQKQWNVAIDYFEKFALSYPKTKEAIDAQFRIAHIYHYNLKKFDIAAEKYYKLTKSYSGLWILSESMYGLGSCLIEIGKKSEGRAVLEKLISEYPETSAASYAKEKL